MQSLVLRGRRLHSGFRGRRPEDKHDPGLACASGSGRARGRGLLDLRFGLGSILRGAKTRGEQGLRFKPGRSQEIGNDRRRDSRLGWRTEIPRGGDRRYGRKLRAQTRFLMI